MRPVIVISGAGLSAESGIPTFRDSNGLWENYRVEDVATTEAWEKDKSLVLKFYQQRFNSLKDKIPNDGHKALARLQEKFWVVNLTQNIDTLLESAGCKIVHHLHGSYNKVKCENHCGIPILSGDTTKTCDYLVERNSPASLGELCPKCNGQLRPDVVWFGEAINSEYIDINTNLINDLQANDGVLIVVGTSLQVSTATYLIYDIAPHCRMKYIVDKNPISLDGFDVRQGEASVQLNKLVDELLLSE